MRTATLAGPVANHERPRPTADRLPLRVALPLIGLASLSFWWGLWIGVNALL